MAKTLREIIDARLRICAAATPGPWREDGGQLFGGDWWLARLGYGMPEYDANVVFFPHARQGYPEALEALKVAVEALKRYAEIADCLPDFGDIATDALKRVRTKMQEES